MKSFSIGEKFTAAIRDLSSDGRGITQHDCGVTVFVPGVWTGEEGVFRITGKKGRIAFAEIVEITKPSSSRRSPPCQYHGHNEKQSRRQFCGGCPWMFVDYAAQLEAKQRRVVNSFNKLIDPALIKPIYPSSEEFGYRNRAQVKTDGKILGFVAAQSNSLVSVEECKVLNAGAAKVFKTLKKMLPNSAWQPRRKNTWTTLDFDDSVQLADIGINRRLPFRQANDQQNHAIKTWLTNKLDAFDKSCEVLELFCGSGNFTEVISMAGFDRVVALEGSELAIATLKQKNLPNVTAQVVDLFQEDTFASVISRHKNSHVLVLDPPRDGLKIRKNLFNKKNKLSKVLYISCDLATLVRDLSDFCQNGFDIVDVQPVDLFPQTPHIEVLVELHRN